jgi:hypothetical protein
VLGYFAWLDEMSLRLLERWPGRVVTVDTLAPRVAVEAELLAALGLASLPPAPAPTAEELRPYIGRYVPEAGRGAPVTVTLEGCTLHASLFWQAGTALEPETGDLFQVRAASATVRFLRDEAGALCGLEYTHFFGTQRYVRAP